MDDESTLTLLRERTPHAALDVPLAQVVRRGSALRRRHRRGQLGAASLGVAVAAIAAVGVVTVHGHLQTAHLEPAASAPAPFAFTVTDLPADDQHAQCAAVLHFAAGTVPGSSDVLTCNDYAAQDAQLRAGIARGTIPFTGSGEDPTLAPVSSRDDRITVGGHRSTVVSGTAPAGTVAVIATDESGRHLTATLVRVGFTPLVFWGFDTTSHKLTGVQYVLADSRHSTEEELAFG